MKPDFITNLNGGLGDCLSVFTTDLPCYSPSPHFNVLKQFSSIPEFTDFKSMKRGLRVETLHDYDFQGHHIFNRARIMSGLEPLERPRAILDKIERKPLQGRICVSFDVGQHATNQRNIHPRARQLYDEHREMFHEFFHDYREDFEFIEIGARSFDFDNIISLTGVGLDKTIEILATAQACIFMHSGLIHLAATLDIPTCTLINFPEAAKLNFKYERELNEPDSHWLYGYQTILHMDEAGGEIDKLSRESLERFLHEKN